MLQVVANPYNGVDVDKVREVRCMGVKLYECELYWQIVNFP